ncbi:hypothetical protein SDC9_212613 [bioreactor metagenome]|uniref:Uncharacterized protein n=1 Tax=bioreactor metagenome TaxID=1076179 RepID=A0A645JMF6_9ZZZZ
MRLHDAGAVKAVHQRARIVKHTARATAARDGLVILVALVAEGEVVHGALAGRRHTQCAKQRVGDTA